MHIIIRACGERTEQRCIKIAQKQGEVHVIHACPFGESIRQTYKLALELGQEWIPVVDADVLLYSGTLARGIYRLNKSKKNIFCLDGKTDDKIMMRRRRAGVHIYRTSLLRQALRFVEDDKTKPESHVRKMMERKGYKTSVGSVVYGCHDYEQYYRDLWRKSVAQSHKLAGMITRRTIAQWAMKSVKDRDYKVILAAHQHGKRIDGKICIDSRLCYGAEEGLKKLGIREKLAL